MKIRNQIMTVNVITLLIAVGITFLVARENIRSRGEADIASVRKVEIGNTKDRLREVVNIAYSLLEKNYHAMFDQAYLEARYGLLLRTVTESAECLLLPGAGKLPDAFRLKNIESLTGNLFDRNRLLLLVARMDNGEIIGGNPLDSRTDSERIKKFIRRQAAIRTPKFIVSSAADQPRISYVTTYPDRNLMLITAITAEEVQREMQEQSKQEIRNCRYAGGVGYVFAFTSDCVNIVHPVLRHLEGTDMSMIRDTHGKLLVTEMVKTCLQENEGWVDYVWAKPRPGKVELPDVPKISYVKLFKPWMWVLGSGAYIDSIDAKVKLRETEIRSQIDALTVRVLLWCLTATALMMVGSWYVARSFSKPLERLTHSMLEMEAGKHEYKVVTLHGSDEIIQLGHIFNRMRQSVLDHIKHIREATTAKEKAETELRTAGEIQNDLIPKIFPPLLSASEFDIFTVNYPAPSGNSSICDFFRIDNEHIGLIMGSISRPGVSGALYNVIIRTMVRSKTLPGVPPGAVLNEINEAFLRNRNIKVYVAIFFGILNLRSGDFYYANAGYNFPLILRKDGQLEDLPTLHGEALCVHRNHCYSYDQTVLKPGEAVFLYNEGLLRCAADSHGITRLDFRKKLKENMQGGVEDCICQGIKTVETMYEGKTVPEDVSFTALSYRGTPR